MSSSPVGDKLLSSLELGLCQISPRLRRLDLLRQDVVEFRVGRISMSGGGVDGSDGALQLELKSLTFQFCDGRALIEWDASLIKRRPNDVRAWLQQGQNASADLKP